MVLSADIKTYGKAIVEELNNQSPCLCNKIKTRFQNWDTNASDIHNNAAVALTISDTLTMKCAKMAILDPKCLHVYLVFIYEDKNC
jgi:hypothetical protein